MLQTRGDTSKGYRGTRLELDRSQVRSSAQTESDETGNLFPYNSPPRRERLPLVFNQYSKLFITIPTATFRLRAESRQNLPNLAHKNCVTHVARLPLHACNSRLDLAPPVLVNLPTSFLQLRSKVRPAFACPIKTIRCIGYTGSRNYTDVARRAGPYKFSLRKQGSPLQPPQPHLTRPRQPVTPSKFKWPKKTHQKRSKANDPSNPSKKEILRRIVDKMKSKVEVLTTPTADTPGTSLLLEFQDKCYLIGHVHEGIQRALSQRGKKLVKITDVFLTGEVSWENIGGLMGVIITAADTKMGAAKSNQDNAEEAKKNRLQQLRNQLQKTSQGTKKWDKINQNMKEEQEKQQREREEKAAARRNGESRQAFGIHGGTNLMYAIACCRRFVFRKGMPLDVQEIKHGANPETWAPTWSDPNIEVYGMPILPLGRSDTPMGDGQDEFLKNVVDNMFDATWSLDQLFETKLRDVQMPATIFVRNQATRKIEPWRGPQPGKVPNEELPDVEVLVRKPWPAAIVGDLPPTKPSKAAMSYIIKNRPQRGKFLADKATALGIPPIMNKYLTQGQTITLENGQTVSPDQVLGPGKPGGSFAVVDLPSVDYIENMTERPEWKSSHLMEAMEGIFWLLGPGVETHSSFQEFIKNMPLTKHIISSKSLTPNYLAFETAAVVQLRLATLDDSRHPVLEFNNKATDALPDGLQHCAIAHPGQVLQLEPAGLWETATEISPLDSAAVVNAIAPHVQRLSRRITKSMQEDAEEMRIESEDLLGADAEIITLGTASAVPSQHRNVSATLLRVPGKGTYLFDAGENTMGQLARMFRHEELLEILRDLKLIWISHMHADHHLGTMSVIKAWSLAMHPDEDSTGKGFWPPTATAFKENPSEYLKRGRLAIVSDKAMTQYIREYTAMDDASRGHAIAISVKPAVDGKPKSTGMFWGNCEVTFNVDDMKVRQAIREMTGLEDLQAVAVDHCNGARAVSISFSDGFKVSYSGDCRPSKRFVEIGKGSTVLIHEATFDDELSGDAKAKKHSTVSEAIRVGMEMGAPRIILTHFSQRYSKSANIKAVATKAFVFEDAALEAANESIIGDNADGDGKGQEAVESSASQATPVPASSTSVSDSLSQKLRVGTAIDYMRVKVKDFAKLERFAPVIYALFDSVDLDGESNTSQGDDSAKKRKRQ